MMHYERGMSYQGGPATGAALALHPADGALHEGRPDVVVHQWGRVLAVIAATVPVIEHTLCC